ncbi:uncharacterized protein LOC107362080 [Tetranychus urticae]|uniref:Band 7 domain-containing protein n=1 Tax=Tetranychus urticae TaxID=32264 RepID=T1KA26_TETUR|nr:uncharacterized protein LOC107362080 [Tetranychus urticae]
MIQTSTLPSASFINDNNYSSTSFHSIFRYSSLPTDEINDNNYYDRRKETLGQRIIRNFILTTAYLLVIFTFPISIWFTVKKIKPLERCIIYRLGKRLPIKGPGLVIVIPFVDVIDFIDLNPHRLCVVSKEQMLTSDGSLIEFIDFTVEMTVFNAIRTSTQLKDSRQNVDQFVKLSFLNTMGGIHVEDLERKMEFIIKQYAETCNQYINKWGWSMVVIEIPRIKVLSRAEPVNNVVKALKGYFGLNDQPNSSAANLFNSLSATTMPNAQSDNEFSRSESNRGEQIVTQEDEIINKLQKLAEDYRYISMLGISSVNITLEIDESPVPKHYQFNPKTGSIHQIELQPGDSSQIIVKASSWANFHEAIDQKDLSKVQITNNLI